MPYKYFTRLLGNSTTCEIQHFPLDKGFKRLYFSEFAICKEVDVTKQTVVISHKGKSRSQEAAMWKIPDLKISFSIPNSGPLYLTPWGAILSYDIFSISNNIAFAMSTENVGN